MSQCIPWPGAYVKPQIVVSLAGFRDAGGRILLLLDKAILCCFPMFSVFMLSKDNHHLAGCRLIFNITDRWERGIGL